MVTLEKRRVCRANEGAHLLKHFLHDVHVSDHDGGLLLRVRGPEDLAIGVAVEEEL